MSADQKRLVRQAIRLIMAGDKDRAIVLLRRAVTG